MRDMGKVLIILGMILVIGGTLVTFGGRAGIGKLPGDFIYRRGSFTFFFPLMTSIVLSVILSLIVWIARR